MFYPDYLEWLQAVNVTDENQIHQSDICTDFPSIIFNACKCFGLLRMLNKLQLFSYFHFSPNEETKHSACVFFLSFRNSCQCTHIWKKVGEFFVVAICKITSSCHRVTIPVISFCIFPWWKLVWNQSEMCSIFFVLFSRIFKSRPMKHLVQILFPSFLRLKNSSLFVYHFFGFILLLK